MRGVFREGGLWGAAGVQVRRFGIGWCLTGLGGGSRPAGGSDRSARALTASLSVLAVLAWGAAASASNEPGSAASDGGASSDRDDARNLGDLTDLQRIRFANARLGGSRGTAALWRFELSEPRKVGLGLRRLDADADLVLEDAEGNELRSSRRAGTAKEWLSATLLTGEYFIRAEATEAGANRFKLRYGVGPADPAAVAELEAAQQAAATARSVSPQPDGDKTTDPPIVPKQGPGDDKTTDPPIVPRLGPGTEDCEDDDTTTCVVTVGEPVIGDREAKDDVDWFKVTLTMGTTYLIDVHWVDFNPEIQGIFDSTGAKIDDTEDDNGGRGGSARVTYTADETGTHFIAVFGATSTEGLGRYRLAVREKPTRVDPCSSDAATNCMIAVPGSVTGDIDEDTDSDWFRVWFTMGTSYEIELRGDSSGGKRALPDPWLRGVRNEDGEHLDNDGSIIPYVNSTSGSADNDSGPGKTALSVFTAARTGNHYIEAFGVGGFGDRDGHYILEVAVVATGALACDDYAPGKSVTAAQAHDLINLRRAKDGRAKGGGQLLEEAADDIMGTATTGTVTTDGTTVTGNIEHSGFFDLATGTVLFPGDKDWFKVTLTTGITYQIDLEGASTRRGGIHDPALGGIFNSIGNSVHSGDSDSGELFNARITFTPTTGGDYFIEVTAPESHGPYNTGKYWLTVTEVS